MSGEARDIFFSDKNLEFTYGVVVQNVEKKHIFERKGSSY